MGQRQCCTAHPRGFYEQKTGTKVTIQQIAGSLHWRVELKERKLDVFAAKPQKWTPRTPIVMCFPGLKDSAVQFYRTILDLKLHEKYGFVVMVPDLEKEFTLNHLGNIYELGDDKEPNLDAPNDVEDWSFTVLAEVFQKMRIKLGSTQKTFRVYGLEEGAEFALRLCIFSPPGLIRRAVIAYGENYTHMDRNVEYPAGVGDLGVKSFKVKDLLQREIKIFVPDKDNEEAETDSPLLRLYESGAECLQRAESLASSMNLVCGWSIFFSPSSSNKLRAILRHSVKLIIDEDDVDESLHEDASIFAAGIVESGFSSSDRALDTYEGDEDEGTAAKPPGAVVDNIINNSPKVQKVLEEQRLKVLQEDYDDNAQIAGAFPFSIANLSLSQSADSPSKLPELKENPYIDYGTSTIEPQNFLMDSKENEGGAGVTENKTDNHAVVRGGAVNKYEKEWKNHYNDSDLSVQQQQLEDVPGARTSSAANDGKESPAAAGSVFTPSPFGKSIRSPTFSWKKTSPSVIPVRSQSFNTNTTRKSLSFFGTAAAAEAAPDNTDANDTNNHEHNQQKKEEWEKESEVIKEKERGEEEEEEKPKEGDDSDIHRGDLTPAATAEDGDNRETAEGEGGNEGEGEDAKSNAEKESRADPGVQVASSLISQHNDDLPNKESKEEGKTERESEYDNDKRENDDEEDNDDDGDNSPQTRNKNTITTTEMTKTEPPLDIKEQKPEQSAPSQGGEQQQQDNIEQEQQSEHEEEKKQEANEREEENGVKQEQVEEEEGRRSEPEEDTEREIEEDKNEELMQPSRSSSSTATNGEHKWDNVNNLTVVGKEDGKGIREEEEKETKGLDAVIEDVPSAADTTVAGSIRKENTQYDDGNNEKMTAAPKLKEAREKEEAQEQGQGKEDVSLIAGSSSLQDNDGATIYNQRDDEPLQSNESKTPIGAIIEEREGGGGDANGSTNTGSDNTLPSALVKLSSQQKLQMIKNWKQPTSELVEDESKEPLQQEQQQVAAEKNESSHSLSTSSVANVQANKRKQASTVEASKGKEEMRGKEEEEEEKKVETKKYKRSYAVSEWSRHSHKGVWYYYNKITKRSQWEQPKGWKEPEPRKFVRRTQSLATLDMKRKKQGSISKLSSPSSLASRKWAANSLYSKPTISSQRKMKNRNNTLSVTSPRKNKAVTTSNGLRRHSSSNSSSSSSSVSSTNSIGRGGRMLSRTQSSIEVLSSPSSSSSSSLTSKIPRAAAPTSPRKARRSSIVKRLTSFSILLLTDKFEKLERGGTISESVAEEEVRKFLLKVKPEHAADRHWAKNKARELMVGKGKRIHFQNWCELFENISKSLGITLQKLQYYLQQNYG